VAASFYWTGLDAVVVGAPGGDALLDGLGLEVLGEGFVDEGGELGVGGEAESDELLDGELVDVGAVGGGEERGETEALFEADEAVLHFDGAVASDACHDEEDDGHDNPPQMRVRVAGPIVNGDVDGEDEVEQKQGQNEEVKGRVPARVVLEALRGGHWSPFWNGLCRRASAYHLDGLALRDG
jgi:hypothetical protein